MREEKPAAEQPLPTKVQTVVVTADENNMRVDRFLEASVSRPVVLPYPAHRPQRRTAYQRQARRFSKDRLEEGQSVRIPPLKLDAPKTSGGELSEAARRRRSTNCAEGHDRCSRTPT